MRDKASYWKWGLTVFLTVCAILVFFDALFMDSTLLNFFAQLMKILSPVLYGLAMAYLLSPILNWFELLILNTLRSIKALKGRNISPNSLWLRAVGIFLTWSVVIFMLYLLMSVLIPQLADSIYALIGNAENYYNTAYSWVTSMLENNPELSQQVLRLLDVFHTNSQNFLSEKLLPQLQALVASLTDGLWTGLWGVLIFAKNLVIGIIISVYLMATKEKSMARCCKVLYSICREKDAHLIMHGARTTNRIFSGFVRGKLLDSLIIGILCFFGCSILKIPYTPLVSVVVGVTNVIPFFGPFLGAIPSAFLILLVNPLKCLYFVIFVLLLQQLDGNVIGPKILGDSTGMSSFCVIVAILVGGGFFGVTGMFLGVPVFACVQALIKFLVDQRLRKRNMPLEASAYVHRDQEAAAAQEAPMQESSAATADTPTEEPSSKE